MDQASLVVLSLLIGMDALIYFLFFQQRTKEERLAHPQRVVRVEAAGLVLADGRVVPLPGIAALPRDSQALRALTRRGVEIDARGRVFGLAKVWHADRFDPVSVELARVDVAHALLYLRYGAVPRELLSLRTRGDDLMFAQRWELAEFRAFQVFEGRLAQLEMSSVRVDGSTRRRVQPRSWELRA